MGSTTSEESVDLETLHKNPLGLDALKSQQIAEGVVSATGPNCVPNSSGKLDGVLSEYEYETKPEEDGIDDAETTIFSLLNESIAS